MQTATQWRSKCPRLDSQAHFAPTPPARSAGQQSELVPHDNSEPERGSARRLAISRTAADVFTKGYLGTESTKRCALPLLGGEGGVRANHNIRKARLLFWTLDLGSSLDVVIWNSSDAARLATASFGRGTPEVWQ